MPRVSIGLPVFNGERFLPAAIDSLLKQTYSDFELVISDNGSTDGTETICKHYAAKDGRVRYYRSHRNRGSVWNFNRVFTLAQAEYFKWAASDDVCAPEYVGACVEVLDSEASVVLCYSDTILIDERGRQIGRYTDRCTEAGSSTPHERFRDLIRNLGLSNPMFGVIRAKALRKTPVIANYIGSDIVMLAEIALLGRFYKIPSDLFFRRDHPQKSDRANPTLEELAVWYRPENKSSIYQLRNSRLFLEYLACLRRHPLGLQQKGRCYLHMAKWLKWELKEISSECTWALSKIATSRRENRA